jgi:hypothetical protein
MIFAGRSKADSQRKLAESQVVRQDRGAERRAGQIAEFVARLGMPAIYNRRD